jgi:fermentation-respiration switch protein FrsA (DUF1100 family)
MLPTMRYLYLLGFASGPGSEKAAFLRDRFHELGLTLETPALVPGEFSQMTISGKLAELQKVLASPPPKPTATTTSPRPEGASNEMPQPTAASGSSGTLAGSSITLVGSSMGGYVATLHAAQNPERIDKLILLAPAFGFPTRWLQRAASLPAHPDDPECTLTVLDAWQQTGFHTVYHHERKQDEQIGYQLVTDAEQYLDFPTISPEISILILHGKNDETVPIEYAQNFLERNPHAKFVSFDADHRLTDPAILNAIWHEITPFISA